MRSIVGKRGRITIPKTLRERLGITPGTKLEFAEDQDKLIVRIAKRNGLDALVGVLPWMDVDAVLSELRGPPDP